MGAQLPVPGLYDDRKLRGRRDVHDAPDIADGKDQVPHHLHVLLGLRIDELLVGDRKGRNHNRLNLAPCP